MDLAEAGTVRPVSRLQQDRASATAGTLGSRGGGTALRFLCWGLVMAWVEDPGTGGAQR